MGNDIVKENEKQELEANNREGAGDNRKHPWGNNGPIEASET